MITFLIGLSIGALVSFALLYFFVLRERTDAEPEWNETYPHLEREFAALRQQLPPPAPRAVTRLTNRERTIQL